VGCPYKIPRCKELKTAIKFIHLSDVHIGVETHGKINPITGRNTRLEDVLGSLDSVFDTAIRESVDLVLIAGDVFHRENPHPTEETEFAKRIANLVAEGKVKIVIALGNHDYPTSFGRAAAVEIFPALNMSGVSIAKKPNIFPVLTKKGVAQIACLPWVGRSVLLTREEYKLLSPEVLKLEIEKRLISIIRNLAERVDTSSPALFLGHVALRDAKLSGTEMTTLLGLEPTLPRSELANPAFSYVALGHVHKFQDLNEGYRPPIVYSGSIERIDFTEEKERKGFVIGEVFKGLDGWECYFEFRETPARRFLTIETAERDGNINEAILNRIRKENIRDAVVRVRYKVLKPEDEVDEKKIREALSQAYSVKIERTFERQERSRLIGLSKTMSVMEALEKYISSKPELKNIAEDMKRYAKELIQKYES
jgi:DNA repair protein SbcD/Mre11